MAKRVKYFKILWISLFAMWCIGMSFTMFYLELFFGMNGVITEISTQYNVKSKDSRIQNAIDNFDDKALILPAQMQNTKSFKNIIGIGCIKCGSTYFNSMLARTTRYWEKNNANSNYHFVFKPDEAHYFDKCDNCTFNGYLELLLQSQGRNDPLQQKSNTKLWIFGEKTVTYFDNYNTAHLLSFYAHQYDIYLYVVLRNPVKQLWSHLWMRYFI